MRLTIDAHHHLWRYTAQEFDWLQGPLAVLRRDFLIDDLTPALAAANVDGTVVVQARQTVEETRWLLELAAQTPEILGVVGWLPLASPDLAQQLALFTNDPWLKGVRHVVQGESDPAFLARPDFNAGIRAITAGGLTYDLLVLPHQLPATIQFVDAHPQQMFVLDHLAKPLIARGVMEPWSGHIRELARRPHVSCKVSGMVTEAAPKKWTANDLRPYLDLVTDAFTPARLLAGSDWPVCLAECDYASWWALLRAYFAEFSDDEQRQIFCSNANDIYKLGVATPC